MVNVSRPDTPRLLPIVEVNGLSPELFCSALTPLFESSPPLATALYAERPFADWTTLIDRAEALAATLTEAQQVAVVNAHPRVGANAADLSVLSYREQAHASEAGEHLDSVYAELERLNDEYEQRFGFRFVVFVDRRSKREILEALRERIENPRAVELQTALDALFLIARDRLRTLKLEPR